MHILQDRAYGCPSIRSDLPAGNPTRRSLADSQNYGDDVPAQDLINPPAFSDLAIDPMAMSQRKNFAHLRQLFEKIGYRMDDQLANAIFDEASQGGTTASINDFRNVLNSYMDAVEDGVEQEWRQLRGM